MDYEYDPSEITWFVKLITESAESCRELTWFNEEKKTHHIVGTLTFPLIHVQHHSLGMTIMSDLILLNRVLLVGGHRIRISL